MGKKKKTIETIVYLNGKLCILRCVILIVYCLENEYYCVCFFFKTLDCFLPLAVIPIAVCVVNMVSCGKHKVLD